MPTRSLPVPLTDADRLTIQKDLSSAISALEQVEAEKREAVSGHNANIKVHKASIRTLNHALVAGTIEREVEVEERPDFARKVVEIIRKDTGDVCGTRAMDPDERQTKFHKVIDGGKKGDAEPTKLDDEAAAARAGAIAARVKDANSRIVFITAAAGGALEGTLQFGNKVLTAIGSKEAEVREAIAKQFTPLIEEEEDARITAELAAAPKGKKRSPKKRKGARAEVTAS